MWSASDQPSRPSHLCGWGCSRPYVDLIPLPLFDVGPQWVAMLRGISWLLPHNGFRPLLVRGICFIYSQACSHPVSTSAPSAQLVLTWSGRVFSCLQGPTPDCPALCLDVVDQLHDQLLSVLSWHSPRPRMVPRRRQPSWWTHECYSTCVARNGAWRDYRRDPNPMLHARFRAARLAFHRTVRSARRTYWSQWQSRVTSLSESQPRLAASVIRHTFCGPAHSRGDQSDHVRWSLDGNSCISQQEVLDNWRRHFASVGASSSSLGSFGEDFHAVVSARFLTVRSVCAQGSGLFDAPFSASEVRHALTLCSDSAVGLDGLPYSLLKLNFPWWQDALLAFFNLVFSWSVVPTVWKRSIIVPVFKTRIAPHIIPQLDESQSGFRWGADVLVGSLVSTLSARSSMSVSGVSVITDHLMHGRGLPICAWSSLASQERLSNRPRCTTTQHVSPSASPSGLGTLAEDFRGTA